MELIAAALTVALAQWVYNAEGRPGRPFAFLFLVAATACLVLIIAEFYRWAL